MGDDFVNFDVLRRSDGRGYSFRFGICSGANNKRSVTNSFVGVTGSLISFGITRSHQSACRIKLKEYPITDTTKKIRTETPSTCS